MTTKYEFLDVEIADGVMTATFNGPDAMNRWPNECEWELFDMLQRVSADDDVRALVITGSGDYFSGGPGHVPGGFQPFAFYERARALVYAFINCDTPVIMAINGPATGTGLTLALTGDIILAERQVTFADAHVNLGVVAATGAYLWPRSTGLLNAKRYLMTGEAFDAITAKEIGLVTEVVDTGQALVRAKEYASKFAAMPAAGVAGTKRVLNQWMRRASVDIFDQGLALEFLRFPAAAFEGFVADSNSDSDK